MDLRTLNYFLAVARAKNITRAADNLHITQPTISRQLRDLEDELGVQLLIRGQREVQLTNSGLLLAKRAEELLMLAHKTRQEIHAATQNIIGDIHLGLGESPVMRSLAKMMTKLAAAHPGLHFHLTTGDVSLLEDRLDKGLLDFTILFGISDVSTYCYLKLPMYNNWGILMRRDSPLAEHEQITADLLTGLPLLISQQTLRTGELSSWLDIPENQLQITATYNLIYNAALLVEAGLGYAFTFQDLVPTEPYSNLTFRPLSPELHSETYLVWKRHQIFPPAAQLFLDNVKALIKAKHPQKTHAQT